VLPEYPAIEYRSATGAVAFAVLEEVLTTTVQLKLSAAELVPPGLVKKEETLAGHNTMLLLPLPCAAFIATTTRDSNGAITIYF
jgi:hypothetical protein